MNFLLDAHLPPSLAGIFQAAGHNAIHTSALPRQNQTPDREINEVSLRQQRVVVTKDTDFYYSHLLQGRPYKLVLVRTGNIGVRDLKALFERHLPEVISALEQNSLVELGREAVRVVV